MYNTLKLKLTLYRDMAPNIQGVLGRKVNILGGLSMGHSKKNVYMYMCPIPNGFRDRAI